MKYSVDDTYIDWHWDFIVKPKLNVMNVGKEKVNDPEVLQITDNFEKQLKQNEYYIEETLKKNKTLFSWWSI